MSGTKIHALSLHTPGQPISQHDAVRKRGLEALRPHLPVSLPLYRRLQFGRFFEATSLLTNLNLTDEGSVLEREKNEPWIIAFVDRSCRPETEVWLYGSWESSDNAPPPGGTEEGLMRDLIRIMKALPVPANIHQDILDAETAQGNASVKDSVGLSRDDYASHMLDPGVTLWGATHERTVPLLQRLDMCSGGRFKAAETPNLMFTWDVDDLPAPRKDLPDGLRWGQLRPEHFGLVRSRTQIPRQDRTLAVLPSLGIFLSNDNGARNAAPIAWVFVGLDASLTTLHVEPEWRGRGLAKLMTTNLFREKMGQFWEAGLPKWAHGYVIRGNKESEGLCRSLQGRSDWNVYWLRVEFGAV